MVYREEFVFGKFLCIWDFKARWIENAFSHCHQKFINNSLCKTQNFTDKVKAFFLVSFPKVTAVYIFIDLCITSQTFLSIFISAQSDFLIEMNYYKINQSCSQSLGFCPQEVACVLSTAGCKGSLPLQHGSISQDDGQMIPT